MGHTETIQGQTYIFMNGKLIHKKRNDNSEGGDAFDVMSYRKSDSLISMASFYKK